jgi:3-oxoacyl-(acyl-carrier-protein) synthase
MNGHRPGRGLPDVVITGIGMVTPAGADTGTSWKTLCAGRSAGARDPRLAGPGVDFSCAVPGFDAELRDMGCATTSCSSRAIRVRSLRSARRACSSAVSSFCATSSSRATLRLRSAEPARVAIARTTTVRTA